MISLIAIMFQIGASSPLFEKPPSAVTVTATKPAETMPGTDGGKEDVIHCKIEPTTGTRFGKKVCMSEQEAYMAAQEAKKTLERMQGTKTLPVG